MIKHFTGMLTKGKTAGIFAAVAGIMLTSTVVLGDWTQSGNSMVTANGLMINGFNPSGSVWGFHNYIQFSQSGHAAIVYAPGTINELMFGFHDDGNFYWGTGQNAGDKFMMSLNKNGNLDVSGNIKTKAKLILQGIDDGYNWRNLIIFYDKDGNNVQHVIYQGPQDNNSLNVVTNFNNAGVKSAFNIYSNSVNISGTVTAQNYACSSDVRYKKNITVIDKPLAKLLTLNGITYNWDTANYKQFTDKRDMGFVAQDVEKVFPEIVYTDSKGYKSVAYDKITAVIVEAMKEMKKGNDAKMAALEKENKLLKEKVASLEKMNDRVATLEKMVKDDKVAKN